MYVDKKLGGVQCIQTLSRLNRTTRGKNRTFVLDFKNEPQDINDSFQRFYKSLVLEGETDPNILYDYLREIKEFNLYTSEDINQFCKSFLNPYREGDEELTQITDPVVDDFKNLETEEEKSIFKSKIQSYMHVYGYLSQIIKFTDIELEKHFLFLKFLNKDLPKRSTTPFYIDNSVDIESLRIQKIYEKVESPVPETQYVSPPRFGTGGDQEPEYDLLSELIDQVNRTYGGNLNEEDKVQLNRLNEKLELDEEVKKYMQGDNSEVNKKNFFSQKCEDMIIDDIENSAELYKKISGDEPVKNFIFKLLYENFQKNLN